MENGSQPALPGPNPWTGVKAGGWKAHEARLRREEAGILTPAKAAAEVKALAAAKARAAEAERTHRAQLDLVQRYGVVGTIEIDLSSYLVDWLSVPLKERRKVASFLADQLAGYCREKRFLLRWKPARG